MYEFKLEINTTNMSSGGYDELKFEFFHLFIYPYLIWLISDVYSVGEIFGIQFLYHNYCHNFEVVHYECWKKNRGFISLIFLSFMVCYFDKLWVF